MSHTPGHYMAKPKVGIVNKTVKLTGHGVAATRMVQDKMYRHGAQRDNQGYKHNPGKY